MRWPGWRTTRCRGGRPGGQRRRASVTDTGTETPAAQADTPPDEDSLVDRVVAKVLDALRGQAPAPAAEPTPEASMSAETQRAIDYLHKAEQRERDEAADAALSDKIKAAIPEKP